MITLEGRTILVTGASKGIGAATARVLLEAGADVVLHWHTEEAEAGRLATEYGPARTCLCRADLGQREAVRGLWQQALGWKGELDGLVNNAAVMPYSAPEDPVADWDRDWDRCWAVNVRAVADLSREAILHMGARGRGTIVTVSSRAAFRGDLADAMHYAASKGALVALTRSIAKNYAKAGIRAYLVAPGWVRTERVAPRIDAPENAHMLAETPMGDAAPPREVGHVIAFLLSGLAQHATGATVDINGASYFH
ncbi:MAG: SDR family oxidoreductase [Alphaproteobacteria bacterium]|nr:MAG: SDR family oxidoreductase [Alphaproteobacteria bacterium]